MIKKYKMLHKDLTTYNGFQWTPYKWHETSGEGNLCGPGWLHCYGSPHLAVLLNPVHANILNPVLWECHVIGKSKHEGELKSGYTGMSLIRPYEIPTYTEDQLIAFSIFCALKVCKHPKFVKWANNWLSNEDRSKTTATWTARAADAAIAAKTTRAAIASIAADAATFSVTELDPAAWAARAAGWTDRASAAAWTVRSLPKKTEIDLAGLALKAFNFETER